jgi:hypothetical protein
MDGKYTAYVDEFIVDLCGNDATLSFFGCFCDDLNVSL